MFAPHRAARLRLALALAALPAVTASCNLNRFKARATETIPVQYVPATPIHVTTRNGSIEILGGAEGKDIIIKATITATGKSQQEADDRLDRVKVYADRDSKDRLIVRADFGDTPRGSDGVSYVITVPDADGARLRTSNGSVKVRGIAGGLDVQSSNGRIDVGDHSGRVKARTSNGSVAVKDASGPVDVHTSYGSVTVMLRSDASGPLDVRTSNGRVNVTVGESFAGKMLARTSNGRVRFHNETGLEVGKRIKKRSGTLRFPRRGPESKLRSSNGSVTITVH
jgi:Toastrack DUF4097